MNAIVAVSEDWGIGRDNKLLFSIPEDMKYFREKPRGAALIMGRSTLESLPGGKGLAGRANVVMSTNPGYTAENALVAPDAHAAMLAASMTGRPVFVIGGESVYRELLPYCDRVYVTKVRAKVPADRFFPDLDADPDWVKDSESEDFEQGCLRFSFAEYVKR